MYWVLFIDNFMTPSSNPMKQALLLGQFYGKEYWGLEKLR